jgi:hypothetical protein
VKQRDNNDDDDGKRTTSKNGVKQVSSRMSSILQTHIIFSNISELATFSCSLSFYTLLSFTLTQLTLYSSSLLSIFFIICRFFFIIVLNFQFSGILSIKPSYELSFIFLLFHLLSSPTTIIIII